MKRARKLIMTAALSLAFPATVLLATVGAGPASGAAASPATVSTVAAHAVASHRASAASPDIAGVTAAAPNCPLGYVCGWTGLNYTGTRGALFENNETLPTIPWHEIQSVYNNGAQCNVWIYRGTDYNTDGGHVAMLYRQTGFYDMPEQLPGLVDHVYSNHWCSPGVPG